MDISKHKDYPSIVEYVYELTKKQFSDITKHRDYNNLVKMIQQKTIKEYGRKTEQGYVKCPNNCELINSINIENHPKFRKLLRAIVKRTIEKYGEPIPGTYPVLYRRCSSGEKNNIQHNIANMSSNRCVKNFNLEGFADVTQQYGHDFDIKHHKQYPELIQKIKAKYSTCENDRKEVEKLREKATVMEDITQNDKYKKLVDAYKKCKVIENDITQHPKYKETADNLACTEKDDISVLDITRHPDINKYVLKSSLPIDLEISRTKDNTKDTDIQKLQGELEKLQNVHSKCVARFQIDHFSGTPTVTSCACNGATKAEDKKADKKEEKKEQKKEEKKEEKKISSVAQQMLDKLTDLTKEVYAKKEVNDDKKFFEIKRACNTALSFLKESNETDVPFIKSVYDLIINADKTGKLSVKKADEIVLSCLEKDQAVKTPAFYINEMLKKETTLAKNEKRLSNDMKDVEYCANNILNVSEKLTKSPAVELAKIQPSKDNEENIKMIKEFRSSIKDEMSEFSKQLKVIETKYDEIKKNVDNYESENKRMKDDIKILYKKFMDRAITKWNQKKEEQKPAGPAGPVAVPPPLPLVQPPVMVTPPPRPNVIYRPVSVNGNDLVSEMRKLNNKVDGIDSKINQIKPAAGDEILGYNNKYSVLY